MSIDYSVHVGPYIVVHNPPVETTEEYHSCPTKGCPNHKRHMSEKFCPACGSGIRVVQFPTKAPKDFDVYKEFDSRLCEAFCDGGPEDLKDAMVFLSDEKGHDVVFDPTNELVDIDLRAVNMPESLDRFQEAFAKEIQRLKEVFGEQAVELRWGVISDAH